MAKSPSVDDLRKEIAKKREAVDAQIAKANEATVESAADLEILQLQAESARLDGELAAAKNAADPGTIKDGNAGNFANAQAIMDAVSGNVPPVVGLPAPTPTPNVELTQPDPEPDSTATGAEKPASGTTRKAGSN